jgi:hypothetical protein
MNLGETNEENHRDQRDGQRNRRAAPSKHERADHCKHCPDRKRRCRAMSQLSADLTRRHDREPQRDYDVLTEPTRASKRREAFR